MNTWRTSGGREKEVQSGAGECYGARVISNAS